MNAQIKLKSLAKKAVLASRVLRLSQKTGVAVLMYHSVKEAPSEHADTLGGIVHATSIFEQQMEILARRCTPVSMDDVLQFVQGEKDLPKQCCAVTFDDGYADNAEIAAPILERLGIPGAFYLTVGYIETGKLPWVVRIRRAFATSEQKSWTAPNGVVYSLANANARQLAFGQALQHLGGLVGTEQEATVQCVESQLGVPPLSEPNLMLRWEQARSLAKRGHIVGSHTVSHPNLAHVKNDTALRHELADSKRQLDAELGISVRHFSYPVPVLTPHWTSHTVDMSRQTGYATAVTTTPGLVYRYDNALSLRRVRPAYDMAEFRWVLENSLAGRAV
jgi:peptidoglycan/xylan/chitin deacetylase (PgdA/CDA1 family)